MSFERYRIPPDFKLVNLHRMCSMPSAPTIKPAATCPCCGRTTSAKQMPFCQSASSYMSLSQQIPLFLIFLQTLMLVLLVHCFVVVGLWVLTESQDVTVIFQVNDWSYQLLVGYKNSVRLGQFIEFILLSLWILLAKIRLKRKKYEWEPLTHSISARSLQISNVPVTATSEQITSLLLYPPQDIVFTYRIGTLHKALHQLHKLNKCIIWMKDHPRQYESKDFDELQLAVAQHCKEVDKAKAQISLNQNRLDIVYVVFSSQEKRNLVYEDWHVGILCRILLKIFPCFSKSQINGKHVTISNAPDPSDIIWLNLQSNYYKIKLYRFLSYFICSSILIFGLGLSFSLTESYGSSELITSLLRSLVTYLTNYLIVTMLRETTYSIQRHPTNTDMQLSLMKKMTFFLFVNLALGSVVIYGYQVATGKGDNADLLNQMLLSVGMICVGNLAKPLASWADFDRIIRYFSYFREKWKGQSCMLTQIEANEQFEPIQFPIALFYSLVLSSLFTTFFFLPYFQILLPLQLLSLFLLYPMSKYLLLRVCKSPKGMSKRLSVLAQRLLGGVVFCRWIGNIAGGYFMQNQDKKLGLWDYLMEGGWWIVAEAGIILFYIIFVQKLVAVCGGCLAQQRDLRDSQLAQKEAFIDLMDYRQSNFSHRLLGEIDTERDGSIAHFE